MLKLREVTDQHVPRPKDTFTYKTDTDRIKNCLFSKPKIVTFFQ